MDVKSVKVKWVKGFVLILVLMLLSPTLYGKNLPAYLLKKNALGIKLGYHFYRRSNFTNFYQIRKRYINSLAFELSYERKLLPSLGIETALGYFNSRHNWHDVLIDGDSSYLRIKNLYVSPSLKYYLPVIPSIVFYVGAGPDLYYTRGHYDYTGLNTHIAYKDNFINVGAHGLTGIEWYFYKHPAKSGFYDWPVSLTSFPM